MTYTKRLARLLLVLTMLGGLAISSSCGPEAPKGSVADAAAQAASGCSDGMVPGTDAGTGPGPDRYAGSVPCQGLVPLMSNDVPFVYDSQSELTPEGLDELVTLIDYTNECGYPPIRRSEGEYYSVYSVEGGRLAYVVFQYNAYTGVNALVRSVVVYPFASEAEEQELWFLLPQDRPEAILGLEG